MRLQTSQQLKLQQQMKLSPRIIQAMEILQLPLLALEERIDQEMVSNPCLEMSEGDGEGHEAQAEEEPAGGDEQDLVVDADHGNQDDFRRMEEFGDTYGEDLDWSDRPPRKSSGEERDAKMEALANTAAPDESLVDHLQGQWSFIDVDDDVRRAGGAIISNLDDDGYLRTPLEELARPDDEAAVTLGALQAALPLVQKLDPVGVGARDLRECLLIQLDVESALGRDVELPRRIVSDFARDVEQNRIPTIARRTGRTVAEVNEALRYLGRLDPRPGRQIGRSEVPFITPDASVDLDEDGNVVVNMLDGSGPSLRVSRLYRKMARSARTDSKAKAFLRNNLRSAQWLIGAIAQRRHTVRRVIEEVFEVQKDFLRHGKQALKPLPMTEVAGKVGVHVATVSRAVSGKYIQTPRGTFPLRMFFSGGTTTAGGEEVAWDAVKAKLQELVDHEDKTSPLNDDQLASELAGQGVKIARRTVAKYRKILNIPSARQRRQY
jgi:RNA polymerase sigma-54 factor